MDIYENEDLEPTQQEPTMEQAEPEPIAEPELPEEAGAYRGQGVGQTETVAQEEFAFRSYPSQGVYQKPQEPVAQEPQKLRENKKLKFWKRAVACMLVVALVVASNCITVSYMNSTWSKQMNRQQEQLESQIQQLEQELDNKVSDLGAVDITAPTEGMTPAQVYLQNLRSVVAISCQSVTNNYGQSYVSTSSGSGFILSADGYVVTNHHVIEGASAITVVTSDEEEYTATLIGSDASNDIALLKIQAEGLRPVTVGSSDELAVGSQVAAIGNALGELGFSLTVGYISGKDRSVTTDGTVINMLQTDAAINSGNSGGPLFNMKGEVVGITTAKYSGSTNSGASIEGIGFAIPMDDVIGMLEDLKEYGYITGVQMGVMVRNMDSSVASAYGLPMGVYVESVVEGSCAQAAGIRSKDVIIKIGDHDIETMNDVTRALRKFKAGDESTIQVWRSGNILELTIVFDAKTQA